MQDSKTTTEAMKKALEEGILEVIIREGKAENIHEKKPIEFNGVVSSPADYIRQRPDEVKITNAVSYVNKEAGEITLFINEREHFRDQVKGKIQVSEKFTELSINGEKKYKPEELAKLLRLKRSLFPSVEDHSAIITSLRNVKAKVEQEVEEKKDDRGGRSKVFQQSVESNMPAAFQMCMPLIQGGAKMAFEVEVVLIVNDGEIFCELHSVDAAEMIDELFEQMIAAEVEFLKLHTTVLFR